MNFKHQKYQHFYLENCRLSAVFGQSAQTLKVAMTSVLLWAAAEPASAAGPVRLGDLKVMLWYQETGRLSENIVPLRDFALHNACIGEGDAKEIANDVLFTAEIRANGEQNITTPIILSAKNSRGIILSKRTVGGVLTGENGRAVLPLLVSNVGCGVGSVTFSVQMGNQKRDISLSFDGGE